MHMHFIMLHFFYITVLNSCALLPKSNAFSPLA
jgi:hypothetical protein